MGKFERKRLGKKVSRAQQMQQGSNLEILWIKRMSGCVDWCGWTIAISRTTAAKQPFNNICHVSPFALTNKRDQFSENRVIGFSIVVVI